MERIERELSEDKWEGFVEWDSESFDAHSVSVERILMGREDYDENDAVIGCCISYTYYLFYEEENRIVYVDMFEKELFGKSTEIPERYLPKELVEWQKVGEPRQAMPGATSP